MELTELEALHRLIADELLPIIYSTRDDVQTRDLAAWKKTLRWETHETPEGQKIELLPYAPSEGPDWFEGWQASIAAADQVLAPVEDLIAARLYDGETVSAWVNSPATRVEASTWHRLAVRLAEGRITWLAKCRQDVSTGSAFAAIQPADRVFVQLLSPCGMSREALRAKLVNEHVRAGDICGNQVQQMTGPSATGSAGSWGYSPEIAELTQFVFAVRDTIGDTEAVPESYPKFQAAARALMQADIPQPEPQNPVERWAVGLAKNVRALVVRYFGTDVEQWSTEPLPARELWVFRKSLRDYIKNPGSATDALERKVTEYGASLNGVWPVTPAVTEVPTTTADSEPPELEDTEESDCLFPFGGVATPVATVEEDLQWFRGWATRINAMLDRPHFQPDRFDWMVFRPDRWAREAMIRFGGKWPVIIRQVQDFLDHAERMYAAMCEQLPVEQCLVCGDDEDYVDDRGYRSCRRCGARARLPDVDWPTVNTARSNAAGAYLRLAEVVETAVDAMEADSTGEAVEVLPASAGDTAWKPAIIVDVDRSRIIFQGETFDVGSPQALRWLKVLTDHPGVWISSADLACHDSELDGARTSRLVKELPETVALHIERKKGTGSRWNPPA